MTDYLFVYGTLRARSGHPMARWLAAQARRIGAATVSGALYDLGSYPGLVPDEAADVHGDVFELAEPHRLLPRLDAYEGFDPEALEASLFRREPRPVRLDDARRLTAWVYLYNRPIRGARPIPSGDYFDR